MNKRILAILVCAAVLISAIGCGSSQKADNSASREEAVAEESVPEELAEDAGNEETAPGAEDPDQSAEGPIAEASPAEMQEESPVAEDSYESPAEEAIEEEMTADSGEYDMQYSFVNLKYADESHVLVIPNGTVGDDTVLYNEKTLGGLCDYIDEKVLEEGRTINRPFLYDLVAVQIVDPTMITGYDQFNQSMIYCLTIANEFNSIDVRIKDLILDYNDIVKQTFEVTAAGKEDSWILDGHEKKFYLNGGNTEYSSTMFDAETMAVWSFVLDEYFDESLGS